MATKAISPNSGERQAVTSQQITVNPEEPGRFKEPHTESERIVKNRVIGGGARLFGHVSCEFGEDGELLPPYNNMGVEITKGLKAGVHTVRATVHGSTLPEVLQKVCALWDWSPDHMEDRDFGRYGYRKSIRLPWGCFVYYDAADGKGHICAELAGDAVGALDPDYVRRWMASVPPVFEFPDGHKEGWKWTRIDVYLETEAERVPDLMELYFSLKKDRSGLRSRAKQIGLHDSEQGTTLTVGRRSSARFVRIYNRRGPVRFELEAKEYVAEQLGQALGEVTDLGEWIRGVIRDAIDFVEPETNSSRAKLAAWWAWIVESAEKVHVVKAKAPETLEKVEAWLEKQVAPAMALMIRAKGGAIDWFYDLI